MADHAAHALAALAAPLTSKEKLLRRFEFASTPSLKYNVLSRAELETMARESENALIVGGMQGQSDSDLASAILELDELSLLRILASNSHSQSVIAFHQQWWHFHCL